MKLREWAVWSKLRNCCFKSPRRLNLLSVKLLLKTAVSGYLCLLCYYLFGCEWHLRIRDNWNRNKMCSCRLYLTLMWMDMQQVAHHMYDEYLLCNESKPYNTIAKTRLYNFDPLKPHFYIVKLGFTGVYIIFLISAQKHRLWVLVRTASSRRF